MLNVWKQFTVKKKKKNENNRKPIPNLKTLFIRMHYHCGYWNIRIIDSFNGLIGAKYIQMYTNINKRTYRHTHTQTPAATVVTFASHIILNNIPIFLFIYFMHPIDVWPSINITISRISNVYIHFGFYYCYAYYMRHVFIAHCTVHCT